MKKKATILALVVASVLLLASCATSTANYYVEGSYYTTQEAGHFGVPAEPTLAEDQVLEGWALAGSDTPYTDWGHQPEGEVRFDAVISTIDYVEFYVNGELYDRQLETVFHEPETPVTAETEAGLKIFDGWKAADASELNEDWSQASSLRYDAVFVDTVRFYLNGELWAVERADEFGYPGQPYDKEIPRGYEFGGWIADTDYQVYDAWDVLPEKARRFDALLVQATVDSAIGDDDQKLNLNLYRDIEVLGPVTVEETYEVIDGEVKIGGIGYKDLLAAAMELYPEADQVINIITDYETQEYTVAYDAQGRALNEVDEQYPDSVKTLEFSTASYTGIAIDIH